MYFGHSPEAVRINAMKEQSIKPMEKAEILKTNPKIDRVLVEQSERFDSELGRLGVDAKLKFNIEPPLGGDRLHLFNE